MRLFTVLLLILMLCGAVADAKLIGDDYKALAAIQFATGNVSAPFNYSNSRADIMNASADMAPKISTGNYESTKYEIPIGPYTVSYELRSPLNYFGVDYRTYNESAGSGKEYHTAQYDIYSMEAGFIANVTHVDETTSFDANGNSTKVKNSPDKIVSTIMPETLNIYLIHYLGPMTYKATDPTGLLYDDIFYTPSSWDSGYVDSNDINIDGKQGREIYEDKQSKKGKVLAYHYEYIYNLDPETIVAIRTSGKWDAAKDLDLFKETLHVSAERD